jgi:hypothetical protein
MLGFGSTVASDRATKAVHAGKPAGQLVAV